MRSGRIVIVLTVLLLILPSFFILQPIVHHERGNNNSSGGNNQAADYSTYYYPIRLVKHGLPAYTTWYASIGPANGSYYSNPPSRTWAKTMTFYEPPGNYSFSVGVEGNYVPENYYIYANVTDAGVIVNITFVEQFNVTVNEAGLPQGMSWGVQMAQYGNPDNNIGTSGTGNNLSVYVRNGSYSVDTGEIINAGVSFLKFDVNLTVNGSNRQITIPFYSVNITEKGLKPGSKWGYSYSYRVFYQNGTNRSISGTYPGSNRSMSLWFPDGSFGIRPQSTGYYTRGVKFNVTGNSINVTDVFQKCYGITFIEHGLPYPGSNYWELTGFPTAYGRSSVPTDAFSEREYLVPNGTYTLNLTSSPHTWSINGTLYYVNITTEVNSTSFTVNGNNTTVNVYFNVTVLHREGVLPNPPFRWFSYVIVPIIILGAVFSAYTALRLRKNGKK